MFPNAQIQALAQAAAQNPALLGQLTQLLAGHNILAAAQQQHQPPPQHQTLQQHQPHQQSQQPQQPQQQPQLQHQPAQPQQSLPQNLSKKRGRRPKNLLPESSNTNHGGINSALNPDNSVAQRLQMQFRIQQQRQREQQQQQQQQQQQLMQQQLQQMVMQQARQQQQRNQLPTPNTDQQQQRRKRGRPPLLSSPRHPAPVDLHASTSSGLKGTEFENYLSMYAAMNGGMGVGDHSGRPGGWPFNAGTSSQQQPSQPIAGPSSRQRMDDRGDRHMTRGPVDQRQLLIERKHKEREQRAQQERDRQRDLRLQQERERQRELRLQQERDRQRELRIQQERERERQRKINHKIALAELDRERRRQHMIMIKNLDAYKRNEEREKTVTAMMAERKLQLERRTHQKRLEVELIKEIRKPVDDMILTNHQSLATLNRIPGLKLPGKAFADLLMSFEFLYNFGDTIGFEMKSLPDINTLQIGLLNLDSYAEDQLISVMFHLVWFALKDPRFPFNGSLKEIESLASDNEGVTQLIHFYLQVLTLNAKTEMEHEQRLFKLIEQKYFLQLNATQKAELLAFVCNELLCSQTVIKQMEDTIENITNLRKSKWVLENDLRRWRTIKTKRELKEEAELKAKTLASSANMTDVSDGEPKTELNVDTEGSLVDTKTAEGRTDDPAESNRSNLLNGSSNLDEQINKGDSDNEADGPAPTKVHTSNDVEEEPEISNEELNKKIDKLNRQYNQTSNKLDKALNSMRANPLGQDRYRRRYWVLPQVGGVFVEGMESTEPEELENNIFTDEELIEYEKEQQALKELTNGAIESDSEQHNSSDPNKKSAVLPAIKRETNNSRRAALEAATNDKDSDNLEELPEALNVDLDEKMDLDQIDDAPSDKYNKEESDQIDLKDSNADSEKVHCIAKKEGEDLQSVEDTDRIDDMQQNEVSAEDATPTTKVENEQIPSIGVPLEASTAAINIPWFSILPRACCEDYEMVKEEETENSPTEEESDMVKKVESEDVEAIADAARAEMTAEELKALRHDICPTLAKRLEQLESEQYENPLKIHPQFQRGWWRITDCQQLKSVLSVMHERGSRERILQKHLAKHFQYACVSCKNTTVDFDITAHDRQLAEKNYGAPMPHNDEDCAEDLNDEMDGEPADEEEEDEEVEEKQAAVQQSANRRSKRKKGSRSARSRRLRAKAAAKKKVENSKKAAVLSQRAQR